MQKQWTQAEVNHFKSHPPHGISAKEWGEVMHTLEPHGNQAKWNDWRVVVNYVNNFNYSVTKDYCDAEPTFFSDYQIARNLRARPEAN